MYRFGYFSLRRLNGRIFWAFIGLASLMLATGIGANFLLNTAENHNQQQIFRLRQVADIKSVQAYIYEQRNNLNMITSYKVSNVLEFIAINSIRTSEILKDISRDFPPEDEAYTQFNTTVEKYRAISSQMYANIGQNRTLEQETELYNGIKDLYAGLDASVSALLESRQRAADASRIIYVGVLDSTRWTYLVIAIILFILAVFFAAIIARLIANPLALLVSQLRYIATNDLTKQMPPKGADEVIELSFIFNRTIVNLKGVIGRIQEQVKNISTTSEQLINSSNTQAGSLSDQAEAVMQTSETILELSSTSNNIAESAALVAQSSNEALESANQCYDKMLGANGTMNEIRLRANATAERILNLNVVAQRIREATLLIDTFSNETHLLALNAAIESAGAGEEGARFAVVAGHVRKLAQRSRVAATDIQHLVKQIQQATASSVLATEENIKVVVLGEKMVSESLQANKNIIDQISQTTQLAEVISQVTQQQNAASTQVAATMVQLSQISNNISYNSQQYVSSANNLGEVINQLNAVVNTFRLDESPHSQTLEAELSNSPEFTNQENRESARLAQPARSAG